MWTGAVRAARRRSGRVLLVVGLSVGGDADRVWMTVEEPETAGPVCDAPAGAWGECRKAPAEAEICVMPTR